MLVELKSGETLNGHLVNCDTWMNLTLKEVIQTSPSGDKFWRLPEIYVRGSTVSPEPATFVSALMAADQIPPGS
jgi:U6 snRNA-associated Sm-like protein LSm4